MLPSQSLYSGVENEIAKRVRGAGVACTEAEVFAEEVVGDVPGGANMADVERGLCVNDGVDAGEVE